MSRRAHVTLGVDRLLASDQLAGRRVGLVCNPASVDTRLRHTVDRLHEADQVNLAALFGPQHGFRSDVQDNMVETSHDRHPRLHIPVYSLYSERREPSAEMLANLDVLVVDLPDVGTRVYTYIYTMANCLRAAAKHSVPVVVCDRPNPIGGEAVEGPVLMAGYESFVGQFQIPLRHGMTIGELALMFNASIGADLEVSPLEGWPREAFFDETTLPWIMPSPNLPTLDSAIVYPGTVLLEGTNLSEGRGTTRPFELLGAPWIDGEALVAEVTQLGLDGVVFRPTHFEPTFQKHANRTCGGCQIHVSDRRTFQPVRTTVALLQAIRRADPGSFAWRPPPYEYETVTLPIDILSGSQRLREQIDADAPTEEIVASWQPDLDAFGQTRREYLIY